MTAEPKGLAKTSDMGETKTLPLVCKHLSLLDDPTHQVGRWLPSLGSLPCVQKCPEASSSKLVNVLEELQFSSVNLRIEAI